MRLHLRTQMGKVWRPLELRAEVSFSLHLNVVQLGFRRRGIRSPWHRPVPIRRFWEARLLSWMTVSLFLVL